jgi:hypothetical protein
MWAWTYGRAARGNEPAGYKPTARSRTQLSPPVPTGQSETLAFLDLYPSIQTSLAQSPLLKVVDLHEISNFA